MAKAVLTFALYQANQLVGRETVAQDVVKVGQDPKSHLCINDPAASRMHAVIEVGSPQEVTLIDLGNDPGTLVNGAPINKCRLNVGDQIQIGSTLVVVEGIEAAAAIPAAAAEALAARPNPARTALGLAPPQMPPPEVMAAGNMTQAMESAAPANPFAAAAAAAAPNPFVSAAPPAPAQAPAPAAAPALEPYGQVGYGQFGHAAAQPSYVQDSHAHDEAEMAEGTYTYTMLKSGPDVSADEVELAHVQAVEVMILWGSNIIYGTHLTPPRNFYVGEEQGKQFSVDFFVPSEKLGTTRMPVVLGGGGSVSVVLPQGATGTIQLPGQSPVPIDMMRGQAQPCAELAGAHQLSLPAGARANVQVADLMFQVQPVNAGKPMAHGLASGFDWNSAMYFGLSFLTIGSLMLAMAFFVPPMGLTDGEGIDQDQLILIQQYLNAAAEKEQEEEETEQVPEEDADNKEGGTGTRAAGEEGTMGKESSKDTNKRYAVQGPQNNPDPHLARQAALREAAEFGMIGLLNTGAAGDPNAPTAPWGRETSLGMDEVSAMGNMWGDEIGDAYGAGGLGLSGIGEGGGGRGEGIGLGSIGTLGHGAGTGTGQGFGAGHGRLGGSHRTKAPRVRLGNTTVSGRLPKEVIQRIVRQNYGRFRLCYEKGLAANPNLQGRVSVRFVINRNGSVSNVANGGSSIPDASVVNCVVRAYYGLSFPKPEGGIVTVVYPISFSPG